MKQWGFPGVLALIVTVLLYCFWVYLNTEMEWTTMSLELLASSQLPSLFSPLSLAYIRTLFALIVWGSIIYIVTDSNGLEITILLTDGKKRTMLFKGFSRLTMFTVWSWILQGIYFTIAAFCTFVSIYRSHYPELHSICEVHLTWLAWVIFEVSFPVAYLVSGVVTFVLIPVSKKQGISTDTFFKPMAILMHNANVLFMAFEFFVNELHFSFHHYIYMLIYGLAYVIFSWIWYEYKKIFYYFFLDYNRNYAILWYAGLLLGILLLFFGGYYLSTIQFHENALLSIVLVGGLTIATMKVFP